jgi:hypothetical protein
MARRRFARNADIFAKSFFLARAAEAGRRPGCRLVPTALDVSSLKVLILWGYHPRNSKLFRGRDRHTMANQTSCHSGAPKSAKLQMNYLHQEK